MNKMRNIRRMSVHYGFEEFGSFYSSEEIMFSTQQLYNGRILVQDQYGLCYATFDNITDAITFIAITDQQRRLEIQKARKLLLDRYLPKKEIV